MKWSWLINTGETIIWGTGRRATLLMNEIEQCFPHYIENIACFVDCDNDKHNKLFFGKTIYSFEQAKETFRCTTFVVALAEPQSVVGFLSDSYGDDEIIIYTDKQFLREIHLDALEQFPGYKEINEISLSENVWRKLIDKIDAYGIEYIVNALYYCYLNDYVELAHNLRSIPKNCRRVRVVGLMCTQFGGGGAERVVANLIPILQKEGYRIILFTYKYEIANEYVLPEGVEHVVIESRLQNDSKQYFREWKESLDKYRVDVLAFHTPYEGEELFYVMLLSKLMGIRFVVECHTSYINLVNQRGLRGHDEAYALTDRLVVLSTDDQMFWTNRGCECSYIPNPCVHVSNRDVVSEKRNKGDSKIILWVGRINQQYKNVLDIVPIMKEVIKKVSGVILKVVGAFQVPKDDEQLKKRITENGLEEVIVLCGEQSNVSKYYDEADVMLMTSPGEGFPMTIAEAMDFGLPIVMYELPYLELVKEGKGVVAVAQGDIIAASKGLIQVLTEDEYRAKLSKDAYENILYFQNYDVGGAWSEVLQGQKVVYNE